MSSWLLPPKHFQVIRDGLYYHLDKHIRYVQGLETQEKIQKFVRDLASMNAKGVNIRYNENHRAPALRGEVKYAPTLVQILKALACVRYQASEGDNLENHPKVMALYNALVAEISSIIISDTMDYQEAPWGIGFDADQDACIEQLPIDPISNKTMRLKAVLRKVRKAKAKAKA